MGFGNIGHVRHLLHRLATMDVFSDGLRRGAGRRVHGPAAPRDGRVYQQDDQQWQAGDPAITLGHNPCRLASNAESFKEGCSNPGLSLARHVSRQRGQFRVGDLGLAKRRHQQLMTPPLC
jgi:hypothetical protein